MTTNNPDMESRKAEYDRQGYTVLRGLYADEEMQRWKAVLRDALRGEPDIAATGVKVWYADDLPGELLAAMRDERIAPLIRAIVGPAAEYLSAKAVFKDGKTAFGSPWHQDWFYWRGSTKLSVWIALDDATPENGCLKVVPGSHDRVWDRSEVRDGKGFNFRIEEAQLAGLPQETLACRRGDAVFFHDLLIHGSHANTVGGDRWSLIATYRDASVPDESTVWKRGLPLGREPAAV